MKTRNLFLGMLIGIAPAYAGDPDTKTDAKTAEVKSTDKPTDLPNISPEGKESTTDKSAPVAPNIESSSDCGLFCDLFSPCEQAPRWWIAGDYLMWWTKSHPLNSPLVTTGPENDIFSGSLGRAGTRVIYGDQPLDLGIQSGFRLQAGMWLDQEATYGVELVGVWLQEGSETATFSGGSNGTPFFGLPFVNANTGQQNVFFVSQNFNDPAVSAFLTGDMDITTKSQFWSYEINSLVNFYRSSQSWLVGSVGFRSMGLDESIRFTQNLRPLIAGGGLTFAGAAVNPGSSVSSIDEFRTENRFYGGQVGTRYGHVFGDCFLSAYASVALGVNHQQRQTEGSSSLYNSNQLAATLPGSVYALPSNIGKVEQNDFAVVPEVGLSLGYQFTPWMSARFGYTFMYWNNLGRATQQIDTTVNPNQSPTDAAFGIPGVNRPGSALRTSDFWAQGINFGLEFKR